MPPKDNLLHSLDAIVFLASALIVVVILILGLQFLDEKPEAEEEAVVIDYIETASRPLTGAELGKQLFRNNCAACHNKDMKNNLTGPALGGVSGRWKKYPEKDLYRWIRFSQQMIAEKHPRALELWKQWKPTVMNDFPNLTDEEIESLLLYIEEQR